MASLSDLESILNKLNELQAIVEANMREVEQAQFPDDDEDDDKMEVEEEECVCNECHELDTLTVPEMYLYRLVVQGDKHGGDYFPTIIAKRLWVNGSTRMTTMERLAEAINAFADHLELCDCRFTVDDMTERVGEYLIPADWLDNTADVVGDAMYVLNERKIRTVLTNKMTR